MRPSPGAARPLGSPPARVSWLRLGLDLGSRHLLSGPQLPVFPSRLYFVSALVSSLAAHTPHPTVTGSQTEPGLHSGTAHPACLPTSPRPHVPTSFPARLSHDGRAALDPGVLGSPLGGAAGRRQRLLSLRPDPSPNRRSVSWGIKS